MMSAFANTKNMKKLSHRELAFVPVHPGIYTKSVFSSLSATGSDKLSQRMGTNKSGSGLDFEKAKHFKAPPAFLRASDFIVPRNSEGCRTHTLLRDGVKQVKNRRFRRVRMSGPGLPWIPARNFF